MTLGRASVNQATPNNAVHMRTCMTSRTVGLEKREFKQCRVFKFSERNLESTLVGSIR